MKKTISIGIILMLTVMLIPTVDSAIVPTVTTNDATGVGTTNATLQGTLTSDGGEGCALGFEYGLTASYGTKVTVPSVYFYVAGLNATTQANARVKQYLQSSMTKNAETTTYGGTIYALIEDATYVYAGGATTNKVFKYWKSNMTKKAETISYGGFIYSLTQDDTYFYVGGANGTLQQYAKVKKYWKSNMTKTPRETASYAEAIYALAQDSTYIYAGGTVAGAETSMRVFQYWKSNMTKKAQTSTPYGGAIRTITQDDTYIYVGGATNRTIKQYWKSNMTFKKFSANYGGDIYALAQDSTYIYVAGRNVTTATNVRVKQYWKSNLTKKAETPIYGSDIYALAQDSTYIYVAGKNVTATNARVKQYWKSNLTQKAETPIYGGYIWALTSASNTGNTFSFGVTGLTPGTLYHYRAYANNSVGGATGSDKIFLTKPNAPTSLVITNYNTQQNLSWTHGTGYNQSVVRGTIGSYPATPQSGTAIYNDTGNTTIHSGLTGGNDWYYRVWEYTVWGSEFKFSDTYAQGHLAVLLVNQPPDFSNENPINGSIGQPLSLTWNITIQDPDGNIFNWTIECNSNSNSANDDINGSKELDISGLSYSTEYTVWVNATDGTAWAREWFTFTTMDIPPNNPPNAPTNESPVNNSDYESVYNEYLNVTVSDSDGNTLDVSFYWGNGTFINTVTGVANNTIASIYLPDYTDPAWLSHDTTYYWYVNVSDGTATTHGLTWNFHTSMAWDINEDRNVDYLDASILMACSYAISDSLPGEIPADIMGDGIVDYLDVSSFVQHYGESY